MHAFRLRDFHPLRLAFPCHSTKHASSTAQSYNPHGHAHGFGLFRVRSPLLTESLLVFFSSAYLDVSVQRVCDLLSTRLQRVGLPHSDINGSRVVCTSPLLFAAYHVLRRLREPRHPPYALISLPTPLVNCKPVTRTANRQNALPRRIEYLTHHALVLGSISFFSPLRPCSSSSTTSFAFPVLSMNSLYHDES